MSQQIWKLIRKLRQDKGLTQRKFGELIGMDFTYLSKMENDRLGTTPSAETLVTMADVLDIDRDWLLTECGRPPERLTKSISENPEFFQRIGKLRGRQLESVLRQPYRLMGQVPAGPTTEAVDVADEFDIADFFSPDQHFLLRVRGESMIEDGIRDGDMAIVRPQPTAENGEVVVALVDGQEATLKRFYQTRAKKIRLQPANENMEPIVVESDRLEIRGKVVGIIRTNI